MQSVLIRIKALEEDNNSLREKIILLEREFLKEVRHQLKQEMMMRKQLFKITKDNNILEVRIKMLEDVQRRQSGLADRIVFDTTNITRNNGVPHDGIGVSRAATWKTREGLQ